MTCPCGSGLPGKRGNVGQSYCPCCKASPRSAGKLRTVTDVSTALIKRQAVARRRIEEMRDEQGER